MKSIKGFVCVLERDNRGAIISGRKPEIFEFDPLEFEPYESIGEVLPHLHKALTKLWNKAGYIAYLELEIAEDEYDELELSQRSSLVVFWKHWYERSRRDWRIAGNSGKNVLLTLKPFVRTKAALLRVNETRRNRGQALLATWRFKVAFDPALDGVTVENNEADS